MLSTVLSKIIYIKYYTETHTTMNLNVYDTDQYPTAYMHEHAHAHTHVYNIYLKKLSEKTKSLENILLFVITNILQ